jgi:cephalosporin-C deacetylase-like acetyl esterase
MKTPVAAWALMVAVGGAGLAAQDPASMFAYDQRRPANIVRGAVETREAAVVTDLTYETLTGARRAAYLVTPLQAATGSRPAVLFVHWYEPPNPTSSRKEFLPDAIDLARDGVISLLVDTMWSDPDWFQNRDPENDLGHSIEQVKELRRALDILIARPGVDRSRVFYVGHDFGAMYGALVAGVDAARLTGFVFMAGTRSFSDRFLLWPKRDDARKAEVVARLAPLDPTRHLARIGTLPVLFQFATRDRFVTKAAAEALAAGVSGPKDVRAYDAEHALNADATRDRLAWLRARLAPR